MNNAQPSQVSFRDRKNPCHLGIYPLFSHLCVTVLQRRDNYLVQFEDGAVLRYAVAHPAMHEIP